MEKELTVIEARDTIKAENDLQLLDVRNEDAFSKYSLPGFENIPLNRLSQEIPNLDPKKKTLIICQDGSESLQALKLLESCGFSAQMVRGGHSDWQKIITTPLK